MVAVISPAVPSTAWWKHVASSSVTWYGSDWPFAPEETGSYFNGYLETDSSIDPAQARAISRSSAEVLFPRLAGLG
jgi:hypothetical protein